MKKCILCDYKMSDNPKIPCNSNNVGYKLKCGTCKLRKARVRGGEDQSDFENKRPKSVLNKHREIKHQTEDMKISMQITQRFKDPLTRKQMRQGE